jgi:hypothetical protein
MNRTQRNRILIAVIVAVFIGVIVWCLRQGQPEISGRVALRGTPPPEIQIKLDRFSATLQPNGLTTRHYLVSSNGGLANVFVWIRAGVSNHTARPATTPAVMEYRGAQLMPYVLGVQTNVTVWLRSSDPIMHNAHIMPRAVGNREKNLALTKTTVIPRETWYQALHRRFILRRPAPTAGTPLTFGAAEPFVRLKCDVHPWEFGYICVANHPFFAVTDAAGKFEFPPGLPPGRYSIEARHLKAGAVTQEVVLARGERKRLEFTLEVPAAVAAPSGPPPSK